MTYVQHKLKNITNIFSSEILFPFPMPNIKTKQICDIQLDYSHLIINPNVPRKNKLLGTNDNNIINLSKFCPNLMQQH
jgi:hypothetical protein